MSSETFRCKQGDIVMASPKIGGSKTKGVKIKSMSIDDLYELLTGNRLRKRDIHKVEIEFKRRGG
jgi:hypothetical protein